MPHFARRLALPFVVGLRLGWGLTLGGGLMLGGASSVAAHPVEVGIIAINDFHGNLEPPHQAVMAPDGKGGTVAVPAGGAAWLASAIDSLKARHPYHLVVAAGDLTSASQLASSLALDEPAVGVMNRIGLDFNAVGNHEFDRGRDELLRLQNGGCERFAARAPCQLEHFEGAHYRYLAASTVDAATGKTLFPASALRRFGTGADRVTIGVIGLALHEVPDMVTSSRIRGLTFRDEAETINAETARLKAAGADAVVVLIHQGARTSGQPDPNGCNALDGDIKPILARLDPRVDLVVSGHTHWDYVCDYAKIDPAHPVLLTSAALYGKEVTDITMTIDPAAHRVTAKHAHNVIVQSQPFVSAKGPVALTPLYPVFAPRPDIAAYVAQYVEAAKRLTTRVVGHLSGPATKGEADGGSLGNLVADSQWAATRGAGADLALMNPFGLRAPLVPAADGSVTFGDLYAVEPFANELITETLTGAELKAVLEQGLDDRGPFQPLTPSAGFSYRFDRSRPSGDRIVAMTLGGKPVDPAATLHVTVNAFLAQGGDTFSALVGKPGVTGANDLDAFEAWLAAVPVRTVPAEARSVSN